MRAAECNLWDGKISPERSGGENFPGRQAAQRPGVARSGPPVTIGGQKGKIRLVDRAERSGARFGVSRFVAKSPLGWPLDGQLGEIVSAWPCGGAA